MDQQTTEPSPVMSWDEWKRRMEWKKDWPACGKFEVRKAEIVNK